MSLDETTPIISGQQPQLLEIVVGEDRHGDASLAPVVTVAGGARGAEVTIEASSTDGAGIAFNSSACFRADADGVVDTARMAPTGGAYRGVDPLGLWWSMRAVGGDPFTASLRPIATTITATEVGGGRRCLTFRRMPVPAGVAEVTVRESGLVGTLLAPSGLGAPAGAVVVLGGSEGGAAAAELVAAHLAGAGFCALALAYIGAPSLPAHLSAVPLEYTLSAVPWLAEGYGAGRPVALVGMSRGAELALLTATMCDRVAATVAFAPSAYRWPAHSPERRMPSAAWTLRGQPLPFAVPVASPGYAVPRDEPWATAPLYQRALADPAALEPARIAVEQAAGPLLLISGGADRVWPSDAMARLLLAWGSERAAAGRDRHLHFPDAGHAFARPPGIPTAELISGSGRRRRLDLGGSPAANAAAAAATWPAVVAFLRAAVGS
ncbi:MAG TPA: acyl-CoA thioesterase/bile acid-CoA:amino acid N-acyltransferase family protein [Acidimicrobiales bacterium]|nr:acyl-CoA thioesterase/bile acid-CoA:amino acid N-acyltransferase family protein [Acidimicrobiales bacterium]